MGWEISVWWLMRWRLGLRAGACRGMSLCTVRGQKINRAASPPCLPPDLAQLCSALIPVTLHRAHRRTTEQLAEGGRGTLLNSVNCPSHRTRTHCFCCELRKQQHNPRPGSITGNHGKLYLSRAVLILPSGTHLPHLSQVNSVLARQAVNLHSPSSQFHRLDHSVP